MNKIIVIVSLLFTSSVDAQTSWEIYLNLPNPENAIKVTSIEYSENAIPELYGYLATDLDILKIQVLSGDKEAFLLTYRLRNSADGGLREDLTAILASSIRSQTKVFLTEIKALNPSEKDLRTILKMSGLEYVDRLEAQKYEIVQRIAAINSIENNSLKSIKEKCLLLIK